MLFAADIRDNLPRIFVPFARNASADSDQRVPSARPEGNDAPVRDVEVNVKQPAFNRNLGRFFDEHDSTHLFPRLFNGLGNMAHSLRQSGFVKTSHHGTDHG